MNVRKHMDQPDPPLVVIVDDDESVREAMECLMRCVGCRAESFDSAEAFLLAGRLSRTDCLILDVKMPGVGGLALQQLIANTRPPVPIIFLTAHWSEACRAEAMQRGAVEFLRKPCAEEALLDAVQLALQANHDRKGG
jgi:FixJ family two-component response regulator